MKAMNESSGEYMTFEKVLDKDGVLVYTNMGISMLPLLRERKDVIEIRRKGEERCKKYDAVLYKRGSKYILHRILRVLPDGYLIAGDNCINLERDITDSDILGIMTKVIRNGKTITPENFVYKLYVHIWCDAYPVRIFILTIYRRIRRIGSRIKHIIIK